MRYYIYKCTGDERWDTLAWLYYGDAALIAPITEANPHVPLEVTLPGGVYIRIPALSADEIIPVNEISQSVPPWRR